MHLFCVLAYLLGHDSGTGGLALGLCHWLHFTIVLVLMEYKLKVKGGQGLGMLENLEDNKLLAFGFRELGALRMLASTPCQCLVCLSDYLQCKSRANTH